MDFDAYNNDFNLLDDMLHTTGDIEFLDHAPQLQHQEARLTSISSSQLEWLHPFSRHYSPAEAAAVLRGANGSSALGSGSSSMPHPAARQSSTFFVPWSSRFPSLQQSHSAPASAPTHMFARPGVPVAGTGTSMPTRPTSNATRSQPAASMHPAHHAASPYNQVDQQQELLPDDAMFCCSITASAPVGMMDSAFPNLQNAFSLGHTTVSAPLPMQGSPVAEMASSQVGSHSASQGLSHASGEVQETLMHTQQLAPAPAARGTSAGANRGRRQQRSRQLGAAAAAAAPGAATTAAAAGGSGSGGTRRVRIRTEHLIRDAQERVTGLHGTLMQLHHKVAEERAYADLLELAVRCRKEQANDNLLMSRQMNPGRAGSIGIGVAAVSAFNAGACAMSADMPAALTSQVAAAMYVFGSMPAIRAAGSAQLQQCFATAWADADALRAARAHAEAISTGVPPAAQTATTAVAVPASASALASALPLVVLMSEGAALALGARLLGGDGGTPPPAAAQEQQLQHWKQVLQHSHVLQQQLRLLSALHRALLVWVEDVAKQQSQLHPLVQQLMATAAAAAAAFEGSAPASGHGTLAGPSLRAQLIAELSSATDKAHLLLSLAIRLIWKILDSRQVELVLLSCKPFVLDPFALCAAAAELLQPSTRQ